MNVSIRNQACPNKACASYNKMLAGNVVIHSRASARVKCKNCGRTWVVHYGEFRYGLRASENKIIMALELFNACRSIRQIATAAQLSPSTVLRWKKRIQN